MARISEDLLLLLLDNPEEQPLLDSVKLGRVLAGALILDLALDRRVRPTLPHEDLPAGHLVALAGGVPLDPSVRPALALLEQRPITPADAVVAIGKHAEDQVLDQLLRTGQLHQVQLTAHRLRRNHYRWPAKNRGRVAIARSELIGALFEKRRPSPVTAAIVGLLHGSGEIGAVLLLNEAGIAFVDERSQEIIGGDWVDSEDTAEVNLSLTLAALLDGFS